EFVRIDMVKLANGFGSNTTQRDDCYRAVIDAATAVEVLFAPRFIDGHMMGDGGVRQYVFLVSPSEAPAAAATLSKVKLRAFALVHGDLEVTPVPEKKVDNGLLSVARRVATIFTDQSLKSSIRLSNALGLDPAAVVGDEKAKGLPRFKTKYAAVA